MRIESTGFSLTDFYGENRVRSGKAESAGAVSAAPSGAARRAESVPAAGRTDKIEITGSPKGNNSVPAKIGESVRREISGDAEPARRENLKDLVAAGRYSADPDELARILLKDR